MQFLRNFIHAGLSKLQSLSHTIKLCPIDIDTSKSPYLVTIISKSLGIVTITSTTVDSYLMLWCVGCTIEEVLVR